MDLRRALEHRAARRGGVRKAQDVPPPPIPSPPSTPPRTSTTRVPSSTAEEGHVQAAGGTGEQPPGEQGGVELDHPPGLGVSAGPTPKRRADDAAADVGDEAPAHKERRRLLCEDELCPASEMIVRASRNYRDALRSASDRGISQTRGMRRTAPAHVLAAPSGCSRAAGAD